MLEHLVTAEVYALMLVFARIGSALMLMPGIGEAYVSARTRLLLAAAMAVLVTPVIQPHLPAMPASPVSLSLLLCGEIGIGIFIGTIGRIMLISLEIAGTLISFQTGLASAQIFNPLVSDQGQLISVLITIAGMVMVFQTDMHHLMLRGLVDSYTLFVPGQLPPLGDFTETVSHTVARAFLVGMQISAPFMVISTMMYIALGLVSRLMPQLQIFFLALPLQIALGFLVLMLTFSSLLLWFLTNFSDVMSMFVNPGS